MRRPTRSQGEQVPQQVRIDSGAPGLVVAAAMAQRVPEQRQRQQRKQPQRAQEMEVAEQPDHVATPLRTGAFGARASGNPGAAASSASSSAADSGQ